MKIKFPKNDEDYELDGIDMIMGIGIMRREEYWGNDKEWRHDLNELKRLDKRRKEIGGFGFRIERA